MKKIIKGLFLLIVLLHWTGIHAQHERSDEAYEERRNNNGIIQYKAIDSNGDGKLDTFYYYDGSGQLERQEVDSDHDGRIDMIVHYVDGIYITGIERDIDRDGTFRDKRFF